MPHAHALRSPVIHRPSAQNYVLSVCYTPDGRYLVSGSKDRTVLFWDTVQYEPQVILQGHKNSIISVTAGGTHHLGTGSGDKRARIWRYTAPSPQAIVQ